MIEPVSSGKIIETRVAPMSARALKRLEKGWRFDWSSLTRSKEIHALMADELPGRVLGLIAIERHNGSHVEVELLESNPRDVGRFKEYSGIAGTLLAFAVRLSLDCGGEGYLAITAKTELIGHYRDFYGFKQSGGSHRMFLEGPAAAVLIENTGEGKMPGRLDEPIGVDFTLGEVRATPEEIEEMKGLIAEIKSRPDYPAKAAEAARILAEVERKRQIRPSQRSNKVEADGPPISVGD